MSRELDLVKRTHPELMAPIRMWQRDTKEWKNNTTEGNFSHFYGDSHVLLVKFTEAMEAVKKKIPEANSELKDAVEASKEAKQFRETKTKINGSMKAGDIEVYALKLSQAILKEASASATDELFEEYDALIYLAKTVAEVFLELKDLPLSENPVRLQRQKVRI